MFILNPYRFATGSAYDSDAQAFFTAAGITDSTQKSAVNQLVLDLKAAGVWTKFKGIYPLVGGTATTHKYNLKNPLDTNAAYRLTFSGGTHNANGLTGGSGAFANTNYNYSTSATLNSDYMCFYSRTNSSGAFVVDMGVYQGSGTATNSIGVRSPTTSRFASQNPSEDTVATASSLGFFSMSRTASTEFRRNLNGTQSTVTRAQSGALPNRTLYLMALNLDGSTWDPSSRNYAFFGFGDGLTAGEDAAVKTAVDTFQTTLGRNV
jgi:hypothetical protein